MCHLLDHGVSTACRLFMLKSWHGGECVLPYTTKLYLTKNKRQLYSDNGFGCPSGNVLITAALVVLL